MKTYDFIGNEITKGCYCAYPGVGNNKGEYGMILYKIDSVKEDGKVKAVRIYVHWGQGSDRKQFPSIHLKNSIVDTVIKTDSYGNKIFSDVSIRYATSTIENTNKLVVVSPDERVKSIFDKILKSDRSVLEDITPNELSIWILGSTSFENPFKF